MGKIKKYTFIKSNISLLFTKLFQAYMRDCAKCDLLHESPQAIVPHQCFNLTNIQYSNLTLPHFTGRKFREVKKS